MFESSPSIILLTGGREFTQGHTLRNTLLAFQARGLQTLIHGDAPEGADLLGKIIGKEIGLQIIDEPAEWKKFGTVAGLLRNTAMLEKHSPPLVLGFPDPKSRGTWHCLAEAARLGIPSLIFISWFEEDFTTYIKAKLRHYLPVKVKVDLQQAKDPRWFRCTRSNGAKSSQAEFFG